MIIFGTRSTLQMLALLHFVCGHCSNPAAQRVMKRVLKFTLFFVPLFPLSKAYYVECVYCGQQSYIDRAQADNYVTFAENAKLEADLDKQFGPDETAPTQ
jgi:hypothetical protein